MTQRRTLWQRVRRWLPWIVLGIILIAVIGVVLIWRASIPPAPSAFYTPPDPLPEGAPGTIIRSEPITSAQPEGAVAWRILYLSTGLYGEPIAVSGVVIAPRGASESPRPVVAWANGTVGVLPECGLSHTRNPFGNIPALDQMVGEGFVVVATDYPGLGTPGVHPYLVGPIEAASVLDSVRAARQLDVNAGDRFVVWGRSQGGHAALWAAQSAADYAPELTLIGAAASAPAIDLQGIFRWGMDRRVGAIVISYALYAWSHVYPSANLDDLVKPELRAQFENVARTCVTTPAAFLTLGNIPTPSEFLAIDPLAGEPYKTFIADNTPHGRIAVPLLISHGTADTLIPLEGSVADAARRCEEGEDVQLVRYPGVQHDAADQSGIMTVGWIADRFEGRPASSNCER